MAILALSLKTLFKLVLFAGIYLLTLRFVHTYPLPMPPTQQHILFALSRGWEYAIPTIFIFMDSLSPTLSSRLSSIWR